MVRTLAKKLDKLPAAYCNHLERPVLNVVVPPVPPIIAPALNADPVVWTNIRNVVAKLRSKRQSDRAKNEQALLFILEEQPLWGAFLTVSVVKGGKITWSSIVRKLMQPGEMVLYEKYIAAILNKRYLSAISAYETLMTTLWLLLDSLQQHAAVAEKSCARLRLLYKHVVQKSDTRKK